MISHPHKAVVATTILLTLGLGPMHPVSGQPASQNPPTEESRTLPTPVANFDPKVPVKVILINQSKMTLEYGLTTSATRRLAAGKTVTYNRVPTPFYAVFYPLTSSSNQYQEPAFKFDVTAQKNVVNIKIRQLQDGAQGDTVIRFRPSGGIFVR